MFGKGISAIGSLLDAAVKYEIIDKKGAWFSYNDEKVGQGRDNAKEYLENNPDFAKEVEDKVRKVVFPGRVFSPTGGVSNAATTKEGKAGKAKADKGKDTVDDDATAGDAGIADKKAVQAPDAVPAEKPDKTVLGKKGASGLLKKAENEKLF
jgi:recombination protein RecA